MGLVGQRLRVRKRIDVGALLGHCGEAEPRGRSNGSGAAGPGERESGPNREARGGRRLGQQAKIEGREKNSFSFSFSNFPNQF